MEDRNVRLAVAIVVGNDRDVIHRAKDEGTDTPDVPGAGGGTEDRNVRLAIPVVVGNDRDITHCAKDEGTDTTNVPGARLYNRIDIAAGEWQASERIPVQIKDG